LHAILATAVSDGILTSNPANRKGDEHTGQACGSDPRRGRHRQAGQGDHTRAAACPGAGVGMVRAALGEVIGLRRKDIAPDCSTITVARAVTHRKGCRIDTPKSGKGRTVVVPPHIREDLANHPRAVCGEAAAAQFFPAARGGCHLNDRVFRDYFTPALAAIGREGVQIHDLRHFAGTQTARVGNLVETMARLGQSTVKASLTYQQMVNGRDVEVAEALSALATAKQARELVAAAEADATTAQNTG
jgi:integrase